MDTLTSLTAWWGKGAPDPATDLSTGDGDQPCAQEKLSGKTWLSQVSRLCKGKVDNVSVWVGHMVLV